MDNLNHILVVDDDDRIRNLLKEYLDEKGLKYSVINADKMFFGSLMKETKSTSVPQIVIKGEFVGDYKGMLQHFLDKEEEEDESA